MTFEGNLKQDGLDESECLSLLFTLLGTDKFDPLRGCPVRLVVSRIILIDR